MKVHVYLWARMCVLDTVEWLQEQKHNKFNAGAARYKTKKETDFDWKKPWIHIIPVTERMQTAETNPLNSQNELLKGFRIVHCIYKVLKNKNQKMMATHPGLVRTLCYNGVSICTVFLNAEVKPVAFSSFIGAGDDSRPAVLSLKTRNTKPP